MINVEASRDVASEFIAQGFSVLLVLKYVGLSQSTYCCKGVKNPKRRGKKSSQYTKHKEGGDIKNEELVEQITDLLGKEFVDYGYVKVTYWLRKKGYIINKKKIRNKNIYNV